MLMLGGASQGARRTPKMVWGGWITRRGKRGMDGLLGKEMLMPEYTKPKSTLIRLLSIG